MPKRKTNTLTIVVMGGLFLLALAVVSGVVNVPGAVLVGIGGGGRCPDGYQVCDADFYLAPQDYLYSGKASPVYSNFKVLNVPNGGVPSIEGLDLSGQDISRMGAENYIATVKEERNPETRLVSVWEDGRFLSFLGAEEVTAFNGGARILQSVNVQGTFTPTSIGYHTYEIKVAYLLNNSDRSLYEFESPRYTGCSESLKDFYGYGATYGYDPSTGQVDFTQSCNNGRIKTPQGLYDPSQYSWNLVMQKRVYVQHPGCADTVSGAIVSTFLSGGSEGKLQSREQFRPVAKEFCDVLPIITIREDENQAIRTDVVQPYYDWRALKPVQIPSNQAWVVFFVAEPEEIPTLNCNPENQYADLDSNSCKPLAGITFAGTEGQADRQGDFFSTQTLTECRDPVTLQPLGIWAEDLKHCEWHPPTGCEDPGYAPDPVTNACFQLPVRTAVCPEGTVPYDKNPEICVKLFDVSMGNETGKRQCDNLYPNSLWIDNIGCLPEKPDCEQGFFQVSPDGKVGCFTLRFTNVTCEVEGKSPSRFDNEKDLCVPLDGSPGFAPVPLKQLCDEQEGQYMEASNTCVLPDSFKNTEDFCLPGEQEINDSCAISPADSYRQGKNISTGSVSSAFIWLASIPIIALILLYLATRKK